MYDFRNREIRERSKGIDFYYRKCLIYIEDNITRWEKKGTNKKRMESLPREIIIKIGEYIREPDYSRMRETSKEMYKVLRERGQYERAKERVRERMKNRAKGEEIWRLPELVTQTRVRIDIRETNKYYYYDVFSSLNGLISTEINFNINYGNGRMEELIIDFKYV